KSFGGSSSDEGKFIKVDDLGNIYITGTFYGTADFDPGPGTVNRTSAGGSDVCIQKLDPSGNFLWVYFFGGSINDYGNSISVDDSGNVYTTGSTSEQRTSFVYKLDASGNFLWVKSFGNMEGDEAQSITVDASGNVYTLGNFNRTL